jgi:hypothetical protein
MKQITVAFRAALLVAVLASLAACSGGIFVDPGHEAGGGGGGGWLYNGDGGDGGGGGSGGGGSGSGSGSGSTKPDKLPNNASASQATAKLDEIIAYCDAHPGALSTEIKTFAQGYKFFMPTYQNTWISLGPAMIADINHLIDRFE